MYQFSYWVHVLMLIVFIFLLVLPFRSRSLLKNPPEKTGSSLGFWHKVLLFSHIALVISLITGFLLRPGFGLWFWIVMVVFLAFGAFLGITMKNTRLAMEAVKSGKSVDTYLHKIVRFSTLTAILLIVIVVLMGAPMF